MTPSKSRKPRQNGQTSPRTPQIAISRSAPTSNGVQDTTPDRSPTTRNGKRKQLSDPPHYNGKRIRPAVVGNGTSLNLGTRSEPASPEPYSEASSVWGTASNLGIAATKINGGTAPGPVPDINGTGNNHGDYPYETLGLDAIRILIVHAGAPNSELDCDLVVRRIPALDASGYPIPIVENGKEVTLDRYEALSYCWDGENPKHAISIRGKNHGSHTLLVTENLLAALRALRNLPPLGPRRFWVDAVCINQKDLAEKSQQLPLMSRIYGEASKVCVWLGPESETNKTSLAFDLMNKLRIVRDFDNVVEERTTCDEWLAFTALMKRSWFCRRWVVQEITLARSAKIYCGLKSIPWKDFTEAVALFELVADRVKKKFRTDPSHGQPPDIFGDVREFSASRLVAVTSNIVAKRDDGQVMQKIWALEALVSDLTSFQAGRSHDIVYAVLSLAKDVSGSASTQFDRMPNQLPPGLEGRTQDFLSVFARAIQKFKGNRFPVDYGKSFYKVCEDFLTFTTTQSKSLDIICRPWAPAEEKSLPSWIRTLAEAPFGRDPNGHWDRINANTLVGMPGQSPYRASGSYHGESSFGEDRGIPILSVKGFKLDNILEVEDAARSGVIPADWLKYGNLAGVQLNPAERVPSTSKVAESFWRTMVAGKGPDGRNPPPYYSCVCEKTFTTVVENSDVNLGQIHDRSENTLQKAYIKRVQSVVWGRKLTKTHQYGFLALVPRTTKRGDYICILFGCSVPVVLRHIKGPKTTNGEAFYQLIGESYVYGMMDGEAFDIRDKAMATKAKAKTKYYQDQNFKIK